MRKILLATALLGCGCTAAEREAVAPAPHGAVTIYRMRWGGLGEVGPAAAFWDFTSETDEAEYARQAAATGCFAFGDSEIERVPVYPATSLSVDSSGTPNVLAPGSSGYFGSPMLPSPGSRWSVSIVGTNGSEMSWTDVVRMPDEMSLSGVADVGNGDFLYMPVGERFRLEWTPMQADAAIFSFFETGTTGITCVTDDDGAFLLPEIVTDELAESQLWAYGIDRELVDWSGRPVAITAVNVHVLDVVR